MIYYLQDHKEVSKRTIDMEQNKKPIISVIIPCYNQETYISECLDSVLNQTFDDYEIIVINDGSKDDSFMKIKEYASKYPSKITAINQENQGVISARNNAIKQARGEYIYPLDGDDIIEPECLEKLYAAAKEHKGDVIYSKVRYFGLKNGEAEYPIATKCNMTFRNAVVVSALYKKSEWEKYGGYDEAAKAGYEDWEFWLNFAEDNKTFYRVNEILFAYRYRENSRKNNVEKKKSRELIRYFKQKHKKLYRDVMFYRVLKRVKDFLYQTKLTKSGKIMVKICKLPLIYIKRD